MQTKINNIQYGYFAVGAILLAVFSTIVFGSSHVFAYNAQEINDKLIGGTNTAVSWDSTCYNNMINNRNNGQGSRTAINNGGSYSGGIWVSFAGKGSQTEITVPSGTKTLNLQLNAIIFLCSSLVSPDGAGANYSYYDQRVVRSDNAPNDRAPNPVGGNTNWPANTDNRLRVDGGSSASDGGSVSLGANSVLSWGRDGGSRYWFANPVGFSYTSPSSGGLTSSQDITITVPYRNMTQYYSSNNYCVNGARSAGSQWSYDSCPQDRTSFTVHVNVIKPWDVSVTSVADRDIAEVGNTITWTHKVNNNGPGYLTTPVTWNWQGDGGPDSGSRTLATGTAADTGDSKTSTYVVKDADFGKKICRSTIASPRSINNSGSITSDDACVIIAKKPKVQVLGGDLVVGRATTYNPAKVSQVTTSTSFLGTTSKYYGSWSEYAIIPSGTVSGMASGAMYVDGASGSNLCTLSVLTISNNNGTGCQATTVGNYASGSTVPNVASRFPVTNSIGGGSVDLKDLASAQTYSVNNATLNISSTQPIGSDGAGKGKWVVINDPQATVTISSNINYVASNLAAPDDIPQVVIIAKNIIIADTVTNVDAWLIATGTGNEGYINTCSTIPAGAPTGIRSSNCNKVLTINGPVLANKLYMYRTSGGATTATIGSPAEVFNLRADAYLWASVYGSSTGRLPTVSTKELPPRF